VVGAMVLAAFLALVVWIIFRPRPDVWTDDAYTTVHYAVIAPRISGQVSTVQVDDNQAVKNGQVLVTLDPRDYETAVASAEATLARDSAQLADVSATLARQPALISQQEAEVSAAQARLAFTEPDAHRYQYLAATDAGTIQQRQLADSALQQSKAQLSNAQAALEAARRQLDVIKAQQQAAAAVVATDKALLEQARLNLSYTVIPAPVDGTVGERSVEVGNTVAPGTTLMTVVPLDSVYITANYREVDLAHVRSGQHATIHVDAYNIDLDGIVDSVAPASGIAFAPIQPNNATGNFTKIVQRLPVKIDVSPNQPLAKLLRVGFSVETTIHTGLEDVVEEQRHSPSRVTEH
jgi:membrane fusion protein (multidrug efflux system)